MNPIMRRIYLIWLLRKLTNPLAIRLAILSAVGLQLYLQLSVTHIASNVSRLDSWWSASGYAWGAFMQTENSVRLFCLSALVLAGWLAWDSVRLFRQRASDTP